MSKARYILENFFGIVDEAKKSYQDPRHARRPDLHDNPYRSQVIYGRAERDMGYDKEFEKAQHGSKQGDPDGYRPDFDSRVDPSYRKSKVFYNRHSSNSDDFADNIRASQRRKLNHARVSGLISP